MGASWRFQASRFLLSRTCAVCSASSIVRQHPGTRAQHPRPQAAAVRPSAEAIVSVARTAARSPNGAQLAFSGIPFVAFADMRAVWCITHRAAALSNARSAPKTTGSRRTAICRGHCLCCRDSCKEPKWGPAGVFRPGTQWVDLRDAKSMAGKYFSQ